MIIKYSENLPISLLQLNTRVLPRTWPTLFAAKTGSSDTTGHWSIAARLFQKRLSDCCVVSSNLLQRRFYDTTQWRSNGHQCIRGEFVSAVINQVVHAQPCDACTLSCFGVCDVKCVDGYADLDGRITP